MEDRRATGRLGRKCRSRLCSLSAGGIAALPRALRPFPGARGLATALVVPAQAESEVGKSRPRHCATSAAVFTLTLPAASLSSIAGIRLRRRGLPPRFLCDRRSIQHYPSPAFCLHDAGG